LFPFPSPRQLGLPRFPPSPPVLSVAVAPLFGCEDPQVRPPSGSSLSGSGQRGYWGITPPLFLWRLPLGRSRFEAIAKGRAHPPLMQEGGLGVCPLPVVIAGFLPLVLPLKFTREWFPAPPSFFGRPWEECRGDHRFFSFPPPPPNEDGDSSISTDYTVPLFPFLPRVRFSNSHNRGALLFLRVTAAARCP